MIAVETTHRYVEPMFFAGIGRLSRSCVPYCDRMVGTREAALVLDVSVATLARRRKRGCSPPYLQLGRRGRVSYAMSDLHDWKVRRQLEGRPVRAMLS